MREGMREMLDLSFFNSLNRVFIYKPHNKI